MNIIQGLYFVYRETVRTGKIVYTLKIQFRATTKLKFVLLTRVHQRNKAIWLDNSHVGLCKHFIFRNRSLPSNNTVDGRVCFYPSNRSKNPFFQFSLFRIFWCLFGIILSGISVCNARALHNLKYNVLDINLISFYLLIYFCVITIRTLNLRDLRYIKDELLT